MQGFADSEAHYAAKNRIAAVTQTTALNGSMLDLRRCLRAKFVTHSASSSSTSFPRKFENYTDMQCSAWHPLAPWKDALLCLRRYTSPATEIESSSIRNQDLSSDYKSTSRKLSYAERVAFLEWQLFKLVVWLFPLHQVTELRLHCATDSLLWHHAAFPKLLGQTQTNSKEICELRQTYAKQRLEYNESSFSEYTERVGALRARFCNNIMPHTPSPFTAPVAEKWRLMASCFHERPKHPTTSTVSGTLQQTVYAESDYFSFLSSLSRSTWHLGTVHEITQKMENSQANHTVV
eukprot:IDg11738t1